MPEQLVSPVSAATYSLLKEAVVAKKLITEDVVFIGLYERKKVFSEAERVCFARLWYNKLVKSVCVI